MIIVAITGASGVILGVRLLQALKDLDIQTGLLISDAAKTIIEYELDDVNLEDIVSLADNYYENDDLTASVNSGSFKFDGAVIIPCSMKTLSAIANAYASNSITRVADVALKERRRLIIVPRETPLRTTHIENMLKISKEGGIILPPIVGYYSKPKTCKDMEEFIVGKVLDSLDIDNDLYKRWK
ncbi:UbiX family flavin prenyltransferase [Methanobrevibacter sp. AbM4]|uniref:UbiX family flavin prenyltransferase n=1 Tax=Methanobrevibacter sp. AbM4 TaxID=224719 RepID=UPI000334884C|nr:UbiX family flavin prenyltransferase [Methanobrevibacter sp. AbM4]AGN16657.1 3-polyprenyl-4-hydroxybenzoate decarboxylase UbiX [Methanobrevibacter sp. AbM4]